MFGTSFLRLGLISHLDQVLDEATPLVHLEVIAGQESAVEVCSDLIGICCAIQAFL